MAWKSLGKMASIYFAIGVAWALMFGIKSWELRMKLGVRPHYDNVIRVESAFLTDVNELAMCMTGRREEADPGNAPVEKFSMTVPLANLWDEPEKLEEKGFTVFAFSNEGAVYVPRANTKPGCAVPEANAKSVAVLRPDNIPARSDTHSYPAGEFLVTVEPPPGERYVLVEVPRMKRPDQPSGYVTPVLVRDSKKGTPFFRLGVEETKKRSQPPWYEFVAAFIVDAAIWPVEIAMWMSGGH